MGSETVITTLYYVTCNGGDGSAHPMFFTTPELAEWHDKLQEEGFCESLGTLKLESEGIITSPDLMDPYSYLVENYLDRAWTVEGKWEAHEFIEQFGIDMTEITGAVDPGSPAEDGDDYQRVEFYRGGKEIGTGYWAVADLWRLDDLPKGLHLLS